MIKEQEGKVEGTAEAWESRELGADERHVRVSNLKIGELDETLELQMISIRLPKELLDDLKLIAQFHGLGYQPLIRQMLRRFAESEVKDLVREYASKMQKAEKDKAEKVGAEDGDDNHRHPSGARARKRA
ncbi:MAG: hypothetical protein CALGDGBN_01948 [Pseudomonadales bacterium]|nr:hypothetical protein [Pseudomonadales bacterium]